MKKMDKEYFDGIYEQLKSKYKNLIILLTGDYELFIKLSKTLPKMKLISISEGEWEGLQITQDCILFLDYNYPKEVIEVF